MKKLHWGAALITSALMVSCVTPGPEAPAPGVKPIHPLPALSERAPAPKSAPIPGFMRGVNVGNYLDSPKGKNWRPDGIGAAYFKRVADLGFDHVRLPVRFSEYAEEKAPYRIDPDFLKKVDDTIELAYKHKLNVVLDLHHYEKLMSDPEGQTERAIALWQQLARHYQSAPVDRLAFEPVNEPMDKLAGDVWNGIANKLIATIRETNPKRLIIINSGYWAAASRLPLLKLPPVEKDPNIIASFHMYEPFLFTHQGASWTTPKEMTATTGIVFPGSGPQKLAAPKGLSKDLQWVADFVRDYNQKPTAESPSGYARVAQEFAHVDALLKTGRRIYMGEFGAIEYADAQSRENYVRLIREEAERRGLAWAYWDDGGAFKLIDLKAGDVTYIKQALFPTEPTKNR